MKVDLHPCYILHQRPYRETSLILDVFSLVSGRISLVARGAKRGKRGNQASLLRPARKLYMAWSIRTDMGTLTTVEPNGPVSDLTGRRLVSCFYMNELLVRMLHKHESHPELFQQYEAALAHLEAGFAEERVLRIFEKHLLKSLGYGLVLDREIVSGGPIVSDARYFYQLDYGPVDHKPVNARNVEISGKTLQAMNSEDNWGADISREAKLLLRMALVVHTGERPLASRELYKAYLQNAVTN